MKCEDRQYCSSFWLLRVMVRKYHGRSPKSRFYDKHGRWIGYGICSRNCGCGTSDNDICIAKISSGTAMFAKLTYPTNTSDRGCPSIPIKCWTRKSRFTAENPIKIRTPIDTASGMTTFVAIGNLGGIAPQIRHHRYSGQSGNTHHEIP